MPVMRLRLRGQNTNYQQTRNCGGERHEQAAGSPHHARALPPTSDPVDGVLGPISIRVIAADFLAQRTLSAREHKGNKKACLVNDNAQLRTKRSTARGCLGMRPSTSAFLGSIASRRSSSFRISGKG
jgi:hypothetical protein